MTNSIPRRNVAAAAPAQSVDYSAKRGKWVLCGKLIINDKEAKAIKEHPMGVPSVFRTLVEGDVVVLARDDSENKYAPRWNADVTFKENTAFESTPEFRLKDVLTECLNKDKELDSTKSLTFANALRNKFVDAKAKASESVLAML